MKNSVNELVPTKLHNFAKNRYMKLKDALRQIIDKEGQNSILDPILVDTLKNIKPIDSSSALEYIFKTFITEGYAAKLLAIGKWNGESQNLIKDFVETRGFQSDICETLFLAIAYGLGWLNTKELLWSNKLYHFTTIEKFAKIWVSKQIRFSEYKKMNDMFEKRKIWQFVKTSNSNKKYNTITAKNNLNVSNFPGKFRKELSAYRQISFTVDSLEAKGYALPMMWGQYAKNEDGVCIEFNKNKIKTNKDISCSSIKYAQEVPILPIPQDDINNHFNIRQFIEENKQVLFFTKDFSWKEEHEFRMIRHTNVKSKEMFLPIQDSINCIYVFQNEGINTNIIKELVKKQLEIRCLFDSTLGGYRKLSWYKIII